MHTGAGMMSGQHLPARQGMAPDMGRRRQYNQQHQQYQPAAMYNPYMNPYNPNYYTQLPPQYPQGGIPPNQYPPYQNYGRSPPPQMNPYAQAPPPPPSYSRPQQSPATATNYQPPAPPPHPPAQPQTPSSTQSLQTMPGPSTPPTPLTVQSSIPEARVTQRPPFHPPLPWLSRPDLPWPSRVSRARRKKRVPMEGADAVELPHVTDTSSTMTPEPQSSEYNKQSTEDSALQAPAEHASNDAASAPTENQQSHDTSSKSTPPTIKAASRQSTAVPILPVLPKPAAKDQTRVVVSASGVDNEDEQLATAVAAPQAEEESSVAEQAENDTSKTAPSVAIPRPSLWTGLFKAPGASTAAATSPGQNGQESLHPTQSFQKANGESIADALQAFSTTTQDSKLAFLKPRGLVNTGNMCYMNSVLQVLVFCVPFYSFLDQVGKRATHSFKSDTPLIDSMIMFMREFAIIDSATSVEQLKMRLKENELELYGEPFTPDFVYEVIRRLPRFSSMRRGHQQDAEEFLGFLLEGLHDECVQVMRFNSSTSTSASAGHTDGTLSPTSETASVAESATGDFANGWLEVGPKQKAAITRSSGTITTNSPITKIFGGTLRSELRVPGLKNSVTLEPYQPLQLDIGDPQINNIIDALKGLTRPEALHGDFKSPKGPKVAATKQVFIETLPPVLILHLKRFQYDSTGGTQKIWKKVGYPLELEIPKEVFSRQQQGRLLGHSGLPKYRLIAVVYHHGNNASGGHYTVDVRRQDGREWIRLDDTVIRRVRNEDVAEGGSEEDPKVLAAVTGAHAKDTLLSGNMFDRIKNEGDEESDGEGWKQVNGAVSNPNAGTNGATGGKKWSSVLNGASTSKTSKQGNMSVKDNKVAYLLFYQKIGN